MVSYGLLEEADFSSRMFGLTKRICIGAPLIVGFVAYWNMLNLLYVEKEQMDLLGYFLYRFVSSEWHWVQGEFPPR